MIRKVADLAVALPQAIWVGATIMRLPEAAGPRAGVAGYGRKLRLLILGDSAAAGVGAETQGQALSGQIAQRVSSFADFEWKLFARSGATTANCLRSLQERDLRDWPAVLLVIGVNDVKNGVRLKTWKRDIQKLFEYLEKELDTRRIYVSGLPPISRFPALPGALARVLGARRDVFDAALQDMVSKNPALVYLPMDFALDESHLAKDKFHPGPDVYAAWADKLSQLVKADLEILTRHADRSSARG